MIWYVLLIAAVAVERVAELVVSQRNLSWSRTRGGVEFGARHYPAMVALHTGLLAGCLVEALYRPFLPALGWPMLAVVLAAQGLRWWCIATLGHQWNTRVVVIPDAARVTGGPYRFFSHPNYVAVVVEGIALPLVHTAWVTAVVFTVLNAVVLHDADQGREHRAGEAAVIDLLVAGGGPAGLATAILGARAGLEVVVVERRRGPVDKACGEGLMPHAVALLDRLGVAAAGQVVPRHHLSRRSRPQRHRTISRGRRARSAQDSLARRAVGGGDGGRRPHRARRCRTGEPGRNVGAVQRFSRPLPGRRRRVALADPRRARPGAAVDLASGGGEFAVII